MKVRFKFIIIDFRLKFSAIQRLSNIFDKPNGIDGENEFFAIENNEKTLSLPSVTSAIRPTWLLFHLLLM